MRYVYFCERCRTTFEVEVPDVTQPVPPEAVCPKCGYPHAMQAFAAVMESGSGCTPGGSC
jgi:rRNA maturation endonuclease Nob1